MEPHFMVSTGSVIGLFFVQLISHKRDKNGISILTKKPKYHPSLWSELVDKCIFGRSILCRFRWFAYHQYDSYSNEYANAHFARCIVNISALFVHRFNAEFIFYFCFCKSRQTILQLF
jgi:hypothetical protein